MYRTVRKVKNESRTGEDSLKEILSDEGKKVRFYLLFGGILLVFLSFNLKTPIKPIAVNETPAVTETPFDISREPIKIDGKILKGRIDKKKSPPIRIIIPTVGIDIPVKEAKVVNGYWEVFPDRAGFGLGSAYPDEIGNQVIYAHAREGLFLPLKKVKMGDRIMVLTKDNWYTYKVKSIKEVLPSQIEVIAPTKETILTLYTCSGYSDSKRLIVAAERI